MSRTFVPTKTFGAGVLIGALLVTAVVVTPTAAKARDAFAPFAGEARQLIQLAMMDEMGKPGGMTGTSGMPPGQPSSGAMGSQKDSAGGPMPATPAMGGMSGMCCMGMMGQPPGAGTGMAMPSALPGFPGASHIYHVGATGFFLEYADKLSLSIDQKTILNGIKQRALLDQSAAQRKSGEIEQALWMLTAADQPDSAAVEAKLRESEKLNADQRLSFIRAVGEAGKVLDAEQRKMILGLAQSTDHVVPPK